VGNLGADDSGDAASGMDPHSKAETIAGLVGNFESYQLKTENNNFLQNCKKTNFLGTSKRSIVKIVEEGQP